MTFEFEGYNFEEYSGPKPFVCDPVLPAKKFVKKKAKHSELPKVCTCTKCLPMTSLEDLCFAVKPMLTVQQFLNKQNKSDLI